LAKKYDRTAWFAQHTTFTIAFDKSEREKIMRAIECVEKHQTPGWVATRGINKGKCKFTSFVRAAVMSAAESLIEE